jgi:putative transposase
MVQRAYYKCTWYGRDLIVVDRWLPSSRICSACGHLTDRLPLSVRIWECQRCGSCHDRDVNAAKNVLAPDGRSPPVELV